MNANILYNKKRLKAKIPIQPVDERWFYTYYSVCCVHCGQPRSRGKGVRPTQRHLGMNCPFRITVAYDRTLGCLVVKECCLEDNLRIGKDIFKHCPSQRKLTAAEEVEIKTVLALKPNVKHLKGHCQKKYGKFLTLRDIYNIRV